MTQNKKFFQQFRKGFKFSAAIYIYYFKQTLNTISIRYCGEQEEELLLVFTDYAADGEFLEKELLVFKEAVEVGKTSYL